MSAVHRGVESVVLAAAEEEVDEVVAANEEDIENVVAPAETATAAKRFNSD